MSKRKIVMFISLMLFFIISLSGCTTTYLDMKKWHGRTINDLYFDRGKADKVETVDGGARVHIWYSKRTVDGQVKTCTKKFYARNTGNAEVIYRTKYSGCLFLTAK